MANPNDPALNPLPQQSSSPRSKAPLQNSESPRAIATGPQEGILAETESSADEETSIVRRENQSGKSRDYLGTADSTSLRERQNSRTSLGRAAQIPSPRPAFVEAQTRAAESDNNGGQSWWNNTFAKYRSIELENKGSVARDHLALGKSYYPLQ